MKFFHYGCQCGVIFKTTIYRRPGDECPSCKDYALKRISTQAWNDLYWHYCGKRQESKIAIEFNLPENPWNWMENEVD
jgi:ribosomal protein L37AE/L43A